MAEKKARFQEGDYLGIVGSYAGLVYHAGAWRRYECGGCMRALGLLKNRLNNGDNARILARFKTLPVEFRHDATRHNAWIQAEQAKKAGK